MAPTTFPLFGYERFFAMNPKTSAKMAHVMTLRGDTATLLQHLPTAVLATFNLHPKMRAALLPGESPLKAMICPQLVDLAELKALYTVTETNDEAESPQWMHFVQHECEKPFNREQDLPFSIRVFVDSSASKKSNTTSTTAPGKAGGFVRIVLFADHYMSDPTSGAIILNSLLQNASMVASQPPSGGTVSVPATAELPLRPSLYECMHWVNPWIGVLNEAVSKWFIEPLFNLDHSDFTPFLSVDTVTQQDFNCTPPERANKSSALFSQGCAENMQRAIAKCEAESVSFQGALITSTLMAFGLTTHDGRLRTCNAPVLLKMDVTCDMRETLATNNSTKFPADGHLDVVGLYSTAANLVFTSSEGVNVHTTSFWDLARRVDHEVQCLLLNHEIKLQSVYVHETLNAENDDSKLKVHNCVLSDVTVANVGAYPYDKQIALGSSSSSLVEVETLHVYNSLPSLAPATMLYVSAVSCFNYSMMHKVQTEVAKDLFHWYVQSVEHIGQYDSGDTLVLASERFTAPTAAVSPLAAAVATTRKPSAGQ
ncbi:hypothetical protein Gpo141_00009968 [Globisporangium polare]